MTPTRRVEFVTDYDPAEHGYRLANDPRCLWGWECAGAHRGGYYAGHGCARPFGHPGRCMEDVGSSERLPCESSQRPKNWDEFGRDEANR